MTVIGIDAHKRTHTLVAIDSGGRKLAQKTISATSAGHAQAIQWATTRFGTDLTWALRTIDKSPACSSVTCSQAARGQ
jgi:transposase